MKMNGTRVFKLDLSLAQLDCQLRIVPATVDKAGNFVIEG